MATTRQKEQLTQMERAVIAAKLSSSFRVTTGTWYSLIIKLFKKT